MSAVDQKHQEYARLVQQRRGCRECSPELVNPAEVRSGIFDCDHLGPWSRWQGSLAADVLIIGQDWGDISYFADNKGRDVANNFTNESLRLLLRSRGASVPKEDEGSTARFFFTNGVLCLKQGGMQADVTEKCFNRCGTKFLRPVIDLIRPRFVVSLGNGAYRGVMGAYGLRPKSRLRDAVAGQVQLPNGSTLYPMYHCSRKSQNMNRPMPDQIADWSRLPQLCT